MIEKVLSEVTLILLKVHNNKVVEKVNKFDFSIPFDSETIISLNYEKTAYYLKHLISRIDSAIVHLEKLEKEIKTSEDLSKKYWEKVESEDESENKIPESTTHYFLSSFIGRYYLNLTIEDYFSILSNQLKLVSEKSEQLLSEVDIKSETQLPTKKIKTNITVEEIAYLFRALKDEKILDIPDRKEKELLRIITNTFSSKKRQNFVVGTLDKHYFNPSKNAREYWQKKFRHLYQYADKENYLNR